MLKTLPLYNYSLNNSCGLPDNLDRASPSVQDLSVFEQDLFTPECTNRGDPLCADIRPASVPAPERSDEKNSAPKHETDSAVHALQPSVPRNEPERSRVDPCSVPPCSAAVKTAAKEKTPAGDLETRAAQCELAQQDRLRAEEILIRMRAERSLHLAKMQAMLANLETEIRRIWEEVTLRRQKIHDDLLAKWEKVLFA